MGLGNCFKTDFRFVKSYLKGVRVWDEKKIAVLVAQTEDKMQHAFLSGF